MFICDLDMCVLSMCVYVRKKNANLCVNMYKYSYIIDIVRKKIERFIKIESINYIKLFKILLHKISFYVVKYESRESKIFKFIYKIKIYTGCQGNFDPHEVRR